MNKANLLTHYLFDGRDGDTLTGYQNAQGKRTDAKAVAVEILRDLGRYRVGTYHVLEAPWTMRVPGFTGERKSDLALTDELLAQCRVVAVEIGHDDFPVT